MTSVEPSRLAAVIVELHRRAYEEAKANGAEVFKAIQSRLSVRATNTAPPPGDDWEDLAPVRYTSSI
ncbi:hypothetical protein ACFV4K_01060 [Nocardia sp. NPDC059764]|uniref:hypothetical protein n=1 Tax=Nocardia sp. NPDC059764 TaxID=3346939 RepID=UPI00365CB056